MKTQNAVDYAPKDERTRGRGGEIIIILEFMCAYILVQLPYVRFVLDVAIITGTMHYSLIYG